MFTNEQLADMVRPDKVRRDVYVNPEIFDLEMQRIYERSWIYVGHESQVPATGDYTTALLGRQQVVLVRASDGKVHVLYNRCPHKGAQVVPPGSGNAGKFFRCPYHAWTFKLDGTMLGAPLRAGYEGTCFDAASDEFWMRKVAQVASYRGFVFANLSAGGPGLVDFLGGAKAAIDNLCDRSPVGEVEVAGGVFRVWQNSNWKVFYENLHDTMHAMVTHESSVVAARDEFKAEGGGEIPFELHIMAGNGEPYQFWEKLELRAFDGGHGYMQGIFDPGAADKDPVTKAHYGCLVTAYGEERARAILGMNLHNTIIYGSGSPHTVFQQFRVIRPIAVDRTMVEIFTFRLKGAPDAVFERAITYANIINSPSSNVMPDDVEVYTRVQRGNQLDGGKWVSMHRYQGKDRPVEGGMVSTNGTSELPMRNQFVAWKVLMTAAETRNGGVQ
jgi:phenylpropionate dioxygenase-like ring-hydroxylating dioxygenase large terminal subunit